MQKLILLAIFLLTIVPTYFSQNLVLNPSFEKMYLNNYPTLPTIVNLSLIEDWYQPTFGSADNFNTVKNTNPKSDFGYQTSKTGISYIGIVVIQSKLFRRYREYLQGTLSQTLKKDKKYEVSFYVSLADRQRIAVSGLGAYLGKEKIERRGGKYLKYSPQVYSDSVIEDKINWVKVSGVYTAKGDEKYITIGDFFKLKNMKKKITDPSYLNYSSYYFIDDVSVVEIPEEIDTVITDSVSFIKKNPLPIIPKLEETRVLENIQFPTNKWVIDTSSYKTLNKLYNYLMTNPFVKIQINGYTDNRGREDFNLNLSEKRAKAVVDYLISKGISETRLNYKGYGVANPIGDNETEEGRSKNRRIEIEIKENGADVLDIVPKK